MSCVFCKIIKNELAADIIYQDTSIIALHDLNPQAPIHILIIPRQHITNLNEIQPQYCVLLGNMMLIAQNLAQDFGIADSGYRLILNTNELAGQTIFHLHLHLIGGRELQWPPG